MIIESSIILVSPQGDRKYVIELHKADDGRQIRHESYVSTETDHEQAMLDHVPALEAQLEAEATEQTLLQQKESATGKLFDYIGTLTEMELKDLAKLSDAEVAATNEIITGSKK